MEGVRSQRETEEEQRELRQHLKSLKARAGASTEEAIESLVKQAEYYANYLLSKHEHVRRSASHGGKRRGHFEEEDEDGEEAGFTRLTQQPFELRGGELKYYQLVGLNWMISLYESGINGILADDMGLGKTIQTIAMLAFLRECKGVSGPHLVIAPKITLGNWMSEFEKWLPACRTVKLVATKEEREEILAREIQPRRFDVVVTSYEGVRLCLAQLRRVGWHYVVIDEAHKIKNDASQLAKVVRRLNTRCKLLLTGTPLQNNLHELWSLLNFLLPDIFDNADMFDSWFESKADAGEPEDELERRNVHMIEQLHKILRPFMLRRTKAEVEKTLPAKKEVHIYVGLTPVQLELYRSLLQHRSLAEDDKRQYMNLLMHLRKVCNHPYLFAGVEPADAPPHGDHLVEASGKLRILDALLAKLKASGGHKVLVFSQMTLMLDILEDFCALRQHAYCRIDGATDMAAREAQIEQFMREDSPQFVFLLSTRAGGLGINLTAADTVVLYDSDWNPQMDLQAMDRAHRIGQRRLVNVYRLITENTVEEKIVERQKIKLKWDSLVIQQQRASHKALTKEEIKDMIQFGASSIFRAAADAPPQDIDAILERGETRTHQLNQALDAQFDSRHRNLVDFSMNNINIFDFMQQDELRRRQDAAAFDDALLLAPPELRGTRRDKARQSLNPEAKREALRAERRPTLPEHHFYPQKELLLDLLAKEDAHCPLTGEEAALKERLLSEGFRGWSKGDFNNFVAGSEKHGRDNLAKVAESVGKPLEEVTRYWKVFWARLDELSEKERVLRQIANGEEKLGSRKLNWELLEWKAARSFRIDFNPLVYTKFKSKFFSLDADRFLAQQVHELGLGSMSAVREELRKQSIFRFDHYLRSRTESELNKRMVSVYKLIEKERDQDTLGFDADAKKLKKHKKDAPKPEDDAEDDPDSFGYPRKDPAASE